MPSELVNHNGSLLRVLNLKSSKKNIHILTIPGTADAEPTVVRDLFNFPPFKNSLYVIKLGLPSANQQLFIKCLMVHLVCNNWTIILDYK